MFPALLSFHAPNRHWLKMRKIRMKIKMMKKTKSRIKSKRRTESYSSSSSCS